MALDIFQEMIYSGVAPNNFTFHSMLAGLCSKEEQRKAMAMLVDLQKGVVCPRIIFVQFLYFPYTFREECVYTLYSFGHSY